jgi:hypothetical protein
LIRSFPSALIKAPCRLAWLARRWRFLLQPCHSSRRAPISGFPAPLDPSHYPSKKSWAVHGGVSCRVPFLHLLLTLPFCLCFPAIWTPLSF